MIKNFADLKRAIQAKNTISYRGTLHPSRIFPKNPDSNRCPKSWILFHCKRLTRCNRNVSE